MNIGDRFRDKRTGRVLEYLRESFDRAGTKERVVYVCKVVLPPDEAGLIERLSVYAVLGPFPTHELVPASAVDRLADLVTDGP